MSLASFSLTAPQAFSLASLISQRFAAAIPLLSKDMFQNKFRRNTELLECWLARVLKVRWSEQFRIHWTDDSEPFYTKLVTSLTKMTPALPFKACIYSLTASLAVVTERDMRKYLPWQEEASFWIRVVSHRADEPALQLIDEEPWIFTVNMGNKTAIPMTQALIRQFVALRNVNLT